MDGLESVTCIKIVPRTTEDSYIKIISNKTCVSYVGRISQPGQIISLDNPGCMSTGIIQHELIHALGFVHMHMHKDRDDYVDIQWANIEKGKEVAFDKANSMLFGNYDTPYDFESVMHYAPNDFSINGKPTIVPKNRNWLSKMGQRVGVSEGDIKRINNMYNCQVTKSGLDQPEYGEENYVPGYQPYGAPAYSGMAYEG
jgi:hypothetical protein